jgi:murein DD-endopeptidase MepM/ murein hydrolase activator NlpD
MKKYLLIIVVPVIVLVVAVGIYLYLQANPLVKTVSTTPAALNSSTQIAEQPPTLPVIAEPISNALSRVTKKTYGIYITPKNSPVSPERFTGYHTGVDFETTPDEQNIDVPVYAICPGKLLIKERASGYGGVINIACTFYGQAVTVTYGHLKLTSITKRVGQAFVQGEQIGVLGKGYSTETDGERKHLHLGIHKGTAAVLHGYVATKAELGQWINVLDFLKKN